MRFMILAAVIAAVTFAPSARADEPLPASKNPCVGCAVRPPAPQPAPSSTPSQGSPTGGDVTPPPVIDRVVTTRDGDTEDGETDTDTSNGSIQFGPMVGASAGSLPVPRSVFPGVEYLDGVPAADGFAGLAMTFAGHHQGAPFIGMSGAVGVASMHSLTWRGDAFAGHMFTDHIGFGGTGGLFLVQYDWEAGSFANELMAGAIGPQFRYRFDDPQDGNASGLWLIVNGKAALGGEHGSKDKYFAGLVEASLNGVITIPGKKQPKAQADGE